MSYKLFAKKAPHQPYDLSNKIKGTNISTYEFYETV